MQEVFKKIIMKLGIRAEKSEKKEMDAKYFEAAQMYKGERIAFGDAIEIVKQEAAERNNGRILCSEHMPTVETEVFIIAKRKFKDGDYKYIRTTAMYEDGKVSENDSCWFWQDIEGEWDEENDCYIIPQGWWESRHYNPDDIYNNAVDDEVVAWQPMPPEYKENGERPKKTNFDRCCESIKAMAQIIDIAKCGWTKEQVMEWLQKEECEVPE